MKRSILLSATVLGTLGLSLAFPVLAANYAVELCAGSFSKTLNTDPTAGSVPMWGYALGGKDAGGCLNTPTAPGPRITVPVGSTGLDITLHNTLPRHTSLVIPGTVKAMTPVFFDDANGQRIDGSAPVTGLARVVSFDKETAPGGTATYSWNLEPGSYMSHSGTNPQVQVQMGLYGAATHDAAAGFAYPGKPYAQDVILFYYEIDRKIHEAVAAGLHNTVDMASTIDYAPKYFLIDVDTGYGPISYEFNDLPTLDLPPNLNPLIRFFNAGLKPHVPTVFEASFDIIAEDAKLYPNVRKQYTVELPPLKTRDAILNISGVADFFGGMPMPAMGRTFRLTDSAMAVSNPDSLYVKGPVVFLSAGDEIANGNDNGMVLRFVVQPEPGYVAPVASGDEPKAKKDYMSVVEGGTIVGIMADATANDTNATGSTATVLSYPHRGELTSDGSGDFTYQHDGSEDSQDAIVYSLTNAAGESSTAGIIITVVPVNDPPVARDDTVNARVGQTIEIRALNNDEDVDSPAITITGVGTSGLGIMSYIDQAIVFEPATVGTESVNYTIADSSGATASATLHVTVSEAPAAGSGTYTPGAGTGGSTPSGPSGSKPTAVDDSYSVTEGGELEIDNPMFGVMANDSMGATVDTTLIEYPEYGSIEIEEDGSFEYKHDGSEHDNDSFTYEIVNDYGSDTAVVTITVIEKMDAPRVNNDKAKTKVGVAVLIDVLKNDKDKDSALSLDGVEITKQPKHGAVEVSGGKLQYTPEAGYKGKDKFRYRLKDSVTGEYSKRDAKVKVKIR